LLEQATVQTPDGTKKRFFVKKELSSIGREQTMQHVRKQLIRSIKIERRV